jgi:cyanophycinase
MTRIFLIGGGWQASIFPQTYGRFLPAATRNDKKRIAFVVAKEEGSDPQAQFVRFFKAFESVGLSSAEAFCLTVSAENPLSKKKLNEIEPTGVFVCGGLTPAYYGALCREKSWLEYLTENKIPYCGFSAGASIAAEKAIIGGWRREIGYKKIQIADENAGENLDLLDVRRGLGLVKFAVDVHATQWGTLSRAVHTVDARFAGEGWAIDENTLLEIKEGEIQISGAGNAYRVRRQNEEILINVFQANSRIL